MTAAVDSLLVTVGPASTIQAGDTATMNAVAFDDTGGMRTDLVDSMSWKVIGGTDSMSAVDVFKVTSTKAYDTVNVLVTVKNNGAVVTKIVPVVITPGNPSRICIEPSVPDPATSTKAILQNQNPLDTVLIGSGVTSGKAFAVLRDQYGNFCQQAPTATWSAYDNAGILAIPLTAASAWEEDFSKAGPSGTAHVSATQAGLAVSSDSLAVIVSVVYDSIRFVVKNGGVTTRIDNLVINARTDTNVTAQGWRADLATWEDVPASWSSSLLSLSAGPAATDSLYASTAGSGTLTITLGTNTKTIGVTVIRTGSGVLYGWYRDGDGDGAIDTAVLIVDSATSLLPDSISLMDPFGRGTKVSLAAGSYAWFNNDTTTCRIIVPLLSKPFAYDPAIGTSFQPLVAAWTYGNKYPSGGITMYDSIGPVLVSAVYTPSAEDGGIDTLIVTFSDDVRAGISQTPFTVTMKSGGTYEFTMAPDSTQTGGKTVKFYVASLNPATSTPATTDSLGYKFTGALYGFNGAPDIAGPESRKIPLQVKPRPYVFTIRVVGPVVPGKTNDTLIAIINSLLINSSGAYNGLSSQTTVQSGTVIITQLSNVIPGTQIDASKATVKSVIYDALGNIIAKLDGFNGTDPHFQVRLSTIGPPLSSTTKTAMYTFWDGRNLSGRAVTGGIYIMQMTFNIGDGYGSKSIRQGLAVKSF